MGIEMEYDGTYDSLEEVEFCQAHPVAIGDSYVLCPNPAKRLYSDLITTKDVASPKVWRKQLGAIAGCGMAGSTGLPVFQKFYQWLGRSATPWIPEAGDYYHKYRQIVVKSTDMKYVEPSLNSRISFFFAYGITPLEQVIMEQHFDAKAPLIPTILVTSYHHKDIIQHLCQPVQKDQDVDLRLLGGA